MGQGRSVAAAGDGTINGDAAAPGRRVVAEVLGRARWLPLGSTAEDRRQHAGEVEDSHRRGTGHLAQPSTRHRVVALRSAVLIVRGRRTSAQQRVHR